MRNIVKAMALPAALGVHMILRVAFAPQFSSTEDSAPPSEAIVVLEDVIDGTGTDASLALSMRVEEN